MKRRAAGTVAAALVGAVGITGCGQPGGSLVNESSMAAESNSSDWVSAPVPLEHLVHDSSTIVVGQLVASGPDASVLRVNRVLKGAGEAGDAITIEAGTVPRSVGDEGVWLLDGNTPPTLLGEGPVGTARQVERLLAGLPRVDLPPSGSDLRALAERAEAVAWVMLESDDGETATARTERVLKGDVPVEFIVKADAQPEQPGGPWRFPTGGQRASAVLFLREEAGGFTAINPTDPTLYRVSSVTPALQ